MGNGKIIDINVGKLFTIAFEKRQKGDYDDMQKFSKDEVENDLKNLEIFISKISSLI